MFENPKRGKQARNFTTNVPKILDLKSSSEQIFSENCRWVPLGCVSAVNLIVEKASAKFWSLCRKVLSPPPTVVYIFKSRDIIAR